MRRIGGSSLEHKKQLTVLANTLEIEPEELSKISTQIWSLLMSYCDNTALSMTEGLEDHGDLRGLESWRRLYTDQRGTLNQRVDDLRQKVLYPDRVQNCTDVVESVTKWESAYRDLTDACEGDFRLDDGGQNPVEDAHNVLAGRHC